MNPPAADVVAELRTGIRDLGIAKASRREFDQLAAAVRSIDEEKASREELKSLGQQVRELGEDVRSLRNAIIGGAITVMVAAIVFALTILNTTHHP